ncbi:MAG: NF038143 family protein [Candidatus Binatia bacterium]
MEKKSDIILFAEESFARAVTLGTVVKRPLSVWHYLIPGIFILDFLRRTSEIKSYTKHFLFPRKLAIDAARDLNDGEDRKSRLSPVENEISEWLKSLKLYSSALHQAKMEEANVLIDHYSKLLNADGDSYNSLVRNAHKSRENYEAHLCQLAEAEKEVDRAVVEKLGGTGNIRERLAAKQAHLEELRKRKVDEIFTGTA